MQFVTTIAELDEGETIVVEVERTRLGGTSDVSHLASHNNETMRIGPFFFKSLGNLFPGSRGYSGVIHWYLKPRPL